MKIQRSIIDGRKATVAQVSKNLIKVMFEDGEIKFVALDKSKINVNRE